MPLCELENAEADVTPSREEREVESEDRPVTAPIPRRRYRWLLAGLFVVVCLAAGFLRSGQAGTAPPPISIEALPLGFQVVQRGDHLLLTWDASAKGIRGASKATLSIQDGPESEDVELSLSVLPLGAVAYHPVFQDVSFRLTLVNPPRRTVSESAHLSLRP
jgi:hypothetical protein